MVVTTSRALRRKKADRRARTAARLIKARSSVRRMVSVIYERQGTLNNLTMFTLADAVPHLAHLPEWQANAERYKAVLARLDRAEQFLRRNIDCGAWQQVTEIMDCGYERLRPRIRMLQLQFLAHATRHNAQEAEAISWAMTVWALLHSAAEWQKGSRKALCETPNGRANTHLIAGLDTLKAEDKWGDIVADIAARYAPGMPIQIADDNIYNALNAILVLLNENAFYQRSVREALGTETPQQ